MAYGSCYVLCCSYDAVYVAAYVWGVGFRVVRVWGHTVLVYWMFHVIGVTATF